MVKYVLNYFSIAGRGEPARLMFHAAGVNFTDNTLKFNDWAAQKNDVIRFPLGQMPTLEVDDVVICQSGAIYSFLANEFGFYGDTNMERATIDQVRETMNEVFEALMKIKYDKSLEGEAKDKAIADHFANSKNKLNFLVKQAKGKFFLGDKVSIVDFLYFVFHEYFVSLYPAVTAEYPKLTALHDAVGDIDNIKKYVSTRTSYIH